MLTSLHISNYALIEKLDIHFDKGFSVITGETGAGKSIILGAIGMLLGQRADAKSVKAGATKCCVEAVFDVSVLPLQKFFTQNDIDFDGQECIIRREMTASGKSRSFVNDTPVSLGQLKEIGSQLIDVHSQHQNLLMGNEHYLLDVLDTMGEDADLLTDYREKFHLFTQAKQELDVLRATAEKNDSDTEYFTFQLAQLEEVQLQEGEQSELEAEAETLSHTEEIKDALFQVSAHLSAEETNVSEALRADVHVLEGVSHVFATAAELSERLESVRIELEDIASEVEQALEEVEFDPKRLEEVNDRLGVIYSLEKKHRVESVGELLRIAEELRARLDRIENADERIAEKEKEVARLYSALLTAGNLLTAARQKAAEQICRDLTGNLHFLGMPHVQLAIELKSRPQPTASGLDNATFLFSANKNVPVQDVARIASGGEIARLMLSLKALISRNKKLPTIVFDEIDTGVSGTMAEKMAVVMQEMAKHCQVLCITHLPQIAALGNTHYRVYKKEGIDGTSSHIDLLTQEDRIREIANMLSGAVMTEAAINNAKSLLRII